MWSKEVKILFLSQPDVIKSGALEMNKCMEAIEEGFMLLSQGDSLAGGPGEHEHGCKIWFPKNPRGENMPTLGPDRRFMAMVGYLGGRYNICGTKWYGSNIENKEIGLPRSILLVILNDPVTGKPLAIMDGNIISAMRTGAVPGVAAKYLTNNGAKVIGIIGAGVISRTCLMSLTLALEETEEILVYDINDSSAEKFCTFIEKDTDVRKVSKVNSIKEISEKSDIINVATSGRTPPLIKNEWLKKNSCLILVGGIEHQEDIYLNSNIVVDDWKMHRRWVEENIDRKKIEPYDNSIEDLPAIFMDKLIRENKLHESNIIDIGDVITGKKKLNESNKRIFISGGLPMEDLAWGYEVYKEAVKKGIGQELVLWEEPHFF